MLENEKAAETTVKAEDGVAGAVEEKEEVNNVAFDDTAKDKPKKEQQSKETNSEYARKRREQERKAEIEKARLEARKEAIIETLRGVNPYTGEPIKDSVDVEEYLTMRDIEKDGGDPVADFSKHTKQRERARAEQEAKEKEQSAWFEKDKRDFEAKYPDVSLDKLIADKKFQMFVAGRVGTTPMTTIYEQFNEFVSEFDRESKEKAAQIIANKNASIGALGSTDVPDADFFTEEQVDKMPKDEIKKNMTKVRRSMSQWKK